MVLTTMERRMARLVGVGLGLTALALVVWVHRPRVEPPLLGPWASPSKPSQAPRAGDTAGDGGRGRKADAAREGGNGRYADAALGARSKGHANGGARSGGHAAGGHPAGGGRRANVGRDRGGER